MLISQSRDEISLSIFRLQKKCFRSEFKDCWFLTAVDRHVVRSDEENKFRSEDCWLTRPLWRGRHVVT